MCEKVMGLCCTLLPLGWYSEKEYNQKTPGYQMLLMRGANAIYKCLFESTIHHILGYLVGIINILYIKPIIVWLCRAQYVSTFNALISGDIHKTVAWWEAGNHSQSLPICVSVHLNL